MGNTASDSLNHSFKRLRLSHTEELALPSPSRASPRRKTACTYKTNAAPANDSSYEHNVHEQLPAVFYKNIDAAHTLSSNFTSERSGLPDKSCYPMDSLSDDEIICLLKSCAIRNILRDVDEKSSEVDKNKRCAMQN
ncbi:unnamed protein product [Adineta ricciae]|uniref:Uncharacterized protein n=1 Tax=Adineta ricciae TaxID=249248 RepID=A0A816GI75_ADIRI|nr:unnamed protein product [Adineta ricciae]